MTRTEGKYWGMWSAIRTAKGWAHNDSAKRHAIHSLALGENKSHTCFTNRDWDRVFAVMRTLIDSTDLDAQIEQVAYEEHDEAQAIHKAAPQPGARTKRARRGRQWASRYEEMTSVDDPGERRQRIYVIERLFEPALVASICRDRWDCSDWRMLPIPSLTELRDLLKNRLGAFITKVKAGEIQYFFPFPLYDETTGHPHSNKNIITLLLRRGIPVKMNTAVEQPVEEPF